MVRPRMPLIAVRANSEEGVFEAKAERNNSTLIIKWAPFIWARWGAPSICPSSPRLKRYDFDQFSKYFIFGPKRDGVIMRKRRNKRS